MLRLAIAIGTIILLCGCSLIPHVVQQPNIHNPFPQLTKVAVAPFFNLSSEPTVDLRKPISRRCNRSPALKSSPSA
jgi:hypothetical protein